jgi:hypothetical protein
MHVVVRENFVPGVSFHAKLEITVPNIGWNTVFDLKCRHMAVKFLAADDGMLQCREEFARSLQDFRDWINESLVIARSMAFDWGLDRRRDVRRTAMSRKKNFDASARGLSSLNENEFVFVR